MEIPKIPTEGDEISQSEKELRAMIDKQNAEKQAAEQGSLQKLMEDKVRAEANAKLESAGFISGPTLNSELAKRNEILMAEMGKRDASIAQLNAKLDTLMEFLARKQAQGKAVNFPVDEKPDAKDNLRKIFGPDMVDRL